MVGYCRRCVIVPQMFIKQLKLNIDVSPTFGNTVLPAVPTWYTPDEMRHYLIRHNYSREIADELAQRWADDLQGAFKKGYEKGYTERHSR